MCPRSLKMRTYHVPPDYGVDEEVIHEEKNFTWLNYFSTKNYLQWLLPIFGTVLFAIHIVKFNIRPRKDPKRT